MIRNWSDNRFFTRLLNPTSHLGYIGCWIQQVNVRTTAVTSWTKTQIFFDQIQKNIFRPKPKTLFDQNQQMFWFWSKFFFGFGRKKLLVLVKIFGFWSKKKLVVQKMFGLCNFFGCTMLFLLRYYSCHVIIQLPRLFSHGCVTDEHTAEEIAIYIKRLSCRFMSK